ncbi:uncharacterized protein BDR25DRAFT_357111 [Lindgomyces ingoldianus]|uniref:Uncharacterized protein n=1 Tax=Lindgomyces ingoldianus TaxID=673940 RepID=A0ACB6QRE5_9PLEO|nr:uncharacterized protein BDR25DRAFT_357111 [Lindgomyces ingoldianus]KAF2468741.1 hypothetical protein BDR25DRAFT_357111 [Lindgomyces ingoldianus]
MIKFDHAGLGGWGQNARYSSLILKFGEDTTVRLFESMSGGMGVDFLCSFEALFFRVTWILLEKLGLYSLLVSLEPGMKSAELEERCEDFDRINCSDNINTVILNKSIVFTNESYGGLVTLCNCCPSLDLGSRPMLTTFAPNEGKFYKTPVSNYIHLSKLLLGSSVDARTRFKTEASTIEGLKIDVSWTHMFCAMQDSLQIDAVCIVQDDKQHWEQDAASIGLVFSNVHYNIRLRVFPILLGLSRQTWPTVSIPFLTTISPSVKVTCPLRAYASKQHLKVLQGSDTIDHKEKPWLIQITLRWEVTTLPTFTRSPFNSKALLAMSGLANLTSLERGDMYFAGFWNSDLISGLWPYFKTFEQEIFNHNLSNCDAQTQLFAYVHSLFLLNNDDDSQPECEISRASSDSAKRELNPFGSVENGRLSVFVLTADLERVYPGQLRLSLES